ncbi:MAG: amylo-alpha-1,6-glucosidase [Verrucomicrobiales bacterium]
MQLSSPPLTDCKSAALGILKRNLGKKGLTAAPDTYPQVWTRDTVITFMGAALVAEPEMLPGFRQSLELLAEGQDRFGQIPFFVRVADDLVRYGSVDSNPWFVLGCLHYAECASDSAWLEGMVDRIDAALDWCEMRDSRKVGLIDSLECDDWADLLSNRGNVLFPNVLYACALRRCAEKFGPSHPEKSSRWTQRFQVVSAAIQDTFWVKPVGHEDKSHVQVRTHASITLRKVPYFLPWVSTFEYGERFDTTANLLAILCGVASEEQAEAILAYIRKAGLAHPHPVRVLHPPIQPGERDWRDYYKVWLNNLPNQYHNGGIWPWVGGVYVAALVKAGHLEEASLALESLASAVEKGEDSFEFNEWLHGQTGEPMGAHSQAWSAGMFLYASHAVATGSTPGF